MNPPKGIAILSLLLVFVLTGAVFGQVRENPESKYLEAAKEAALWLEFQAKSNSVIPDEVGKTDSSPTIGTGSAGRLIFFLELYYATKDQRYLDQAEREADLAIAQTPQTYNRYGLYNGLAGIAFSLNELSKANEKFARFRLAADERFVRIAKAAKWKGTAANWSNSNDILTGTAGIGLALLYASRNFGNPFFTLTAKGAANELINRAEKSDGGLRWHRFNDRELDLPNFSHGTAGIAYYLAEFGGAFKDKKYIEAAESGALYLIAIADKKSGLFLVPYGVPNDGYVTKYDIGWAHGPAGTGRLFVKLWIVTGDRSYKRIAEANARSILASGAPGQTRDKSKWTGPFKMDQRFGTSGAASYLIGLRKISNRRENTAVARQIGAEILAASNNAGTGLNWKLPRYGFQVGEGEAVFTGYFYGSAGFGMTMLELFFVENGGNRSVRLPDDPFLGNS
jgi:lantibiotic modifying enzyme